MNTEALNLSHGPHVRDRWTTRFIMHIVALALLPATVVGIVSHGLPALWVVLTSVVASVGTEFLFDKFCKKPDTWLDGSALVTGLLLALTLSPYMPVYQVALGAIFAILVVKCCFGGLGKNFVNPALAGRCFLLVSFGGTMTRYFPDGVSGATPVAELLDGKSVDVLQMFLGQSSGVIGSCILALLIGGLVLWATDIIHGQICFSVVAAFTLFIGLFGGRGFDPYFLASHLCGGGVILGAFFMATDYVTSPVGVLGQTIYGALIGILGATFRLFGSSADSFSYAILIANLTVPLIDTYVIPKPFAFRKRAIRMQKGEPRKRLSQRIPKPAIVLTVVALIAGLALSGVFTMTEQPLAEQREKAKVEAYQQVLSGAERFDTIPGAEDYTSTAFGKTTINDAVEGKNAAGETVGYGVSVTTAGAKGDISLTVGVDPSGRLTSVSFTDMGSETPGLGTLCGEPAFRDQFSGRSVDAFKLLPSGGASAENEIDGVTGATITSRAVVNAVNAALDFCKTGIGR